MRRSAFAKLSAAALVLGLLTAAPAMAQSPQTAPSENKMAPPSKMAPGGKMAPAEKMAPAPKTDLLDINSAPVEALEGLPGIGKAYSAAIIKNRPYKGKDDLVHKKVVPQKTYDGIKDKIIAKQKT